MHLKNSFWQIQMLSEGYSGYSGYSYVSSCIENGTRALLDVPYVWDLQEELRKENTRLTRVVEALAINSVW